MKERGILFSAPMVRALLSGAKTQTRRGIRPEWLRCLDPDEDRDEVLARCPYGRPGDRLWVRETWAQDDEDGCVMYRADLGRDANADAWEQGRIEGVPRYRWRPSIFMPRWASRITLELTAVRVERLQDISEADAQAEGASYHDGRGIGHSGWRHDFGDVHANARSAYARLWESINGPGSWAANPWVWVLSFRRLP